MNSNNPFANFDIDHLSASSLNTYINDPCMFIIRYIFGFKGKGNPAMWRGTVVDQIIGMMLMSQKVIDQDYMEDLIKQAIARFDGLYEHYKDEMTIDEKKYSKERLAIEKYLSVAIPFYKQLGEPVSYQEEVRLQLDSVPIDIIGYIDLEYKGLVRDIKTVGRMPSEVPDSVKRQMSVYATAKQCDVVVDYVYASSSKAEVKVVEVKDVEQHIKVVEKTALAVMNLLSYSNDKYEIARLFVPNFDSWMWSSEEDIEFAKSIWEI